MVLTVIIYSARAIPFFFNAFSIFLPLVLTAGIYLYLNRKIVYNKKSRLPFVVFAFLMLIYIVKFIAIDFLFIAYYLSLIAIAFFVITTLGASFFKYYEKIVYFLAVLSILLLVIQVIYEPLLVQLAKLVERLLFIPPSEKYTTMVIYTINHNNTPGFRNCGFAWEPGPYSVLLIIAIFFRFLINGIKFDKHIIVFIIAILTTFSTTGYIGLIALLAFFLYNKRKKILLIAGPIFILVTTFAFLSLPFLKEKIFEQFYSSEDVLKSEMMRTDDTKVSIGRFSGFLLNLEDLKNNPVFGYGGQIKEETVASNMGLGITSTSGLGNWIAQFGIVGLLILIITYYRSINKILSENQYRGLTFIALTFLIVGFAFNLLNTVLFFCVMFYYFFAPKSVDFKDYTYDKI